MGEWSGIEPNGRLLLSCRLNRMAPMSSTALTPSNCASGHGHAAESVESERTAAKRCAVFIVVAIRLCRGTNVPIATSG